VLANLFSTVCQHGGSQEEVVFLALNDESAFKSVQKLVGLASCVYYLIVVEHQLRQTIHVNASICKRSCPHETLILILRSNVLEPAVKR